MDSCDKDVFTEEWGESIVEIERKMRLVEGENEKQEEEVMVQEMNQAYQYALVKESLLHLITKKELF